MWNDPDLDSHSRQSQRGGKKNDKAPKEDLTAFGYECLLFRNDGLSEAIEQGRMLITWQGLDPEDEDALWVDRGILIAYPMVTIRRKQGDYGRSVVHLLTITAVSSSLEHLRYDARNLLDNTRYFLGPVELSENSGLDAPDLDEERFEDLDSEEEFMFDMDEDERDDYLAQKREQESESSYKGVHYDYDGTASLPVQEPTFRVHFDVPEGMSVPDTEKTLALIERTAKFVNSSSEPAMEAILQGKQATNPSFAFLSRRHHLFAFYKHIRWLMQTGLYEILEDYRQREADEAKAEEEDKLRQEANAVAEANEANKRQVAYYKAPTAHNLS
ncbi:hypothetical protein BGW38_000541 [Lunasporangiospora selenospora]|uniref:SURP motif domain-containing protein n=1 Tax=Lunasporangiospora selenospora TaxID=979761 RepID=A0A9P6G403_9FUNG|nr:hypothetical protein BGW38_000541 [Lunasporangiospora selenospora]